MPEPRHRAFFSGAPGAAIEDAATDFPEEDAMDADFWRAKWRGGELGWRRSHAHPMLVGRFSALGLKAGARMFVPLCGDTLDIGWLRDAGFRVSGVELVESAVRKLFEGLGVEPAVSDVGPLTLYAADGVDIFVGDLFALSREVLGAVDGTYDRAALVALPAETRPAYAAHLAEITARAPQLLITFEYDQGLMAGPPFSVSDEEVKGLYAAAYGVEMLESAEVEGGLKGFCPATEKAWRLARR